MADSRINQLLQKISRLKTLILFVLVVVLFFFIYSPIPLSSTWDLIKQRGVLIYGTRTSLLSYFEDDDAIIGFEYQILKRFADQHGLELKAVVYNNNGELFNDLEHGQVDIAGGHLTITEERLEQYQFTAPISQTAIDLVTHFDHRNKTEIQEFENTKGLLLANSSYLELFQSLEDFSPNDLSTTDDLTLFELIRKINSKEIDYTLGDSEIINIYQRFIPGIYQTIQVSAATDTALMIRQNRSNEFKTQLDQFINSARDSQLLDQLKNEIVLHLPDIDTANTVTFFDKLQTDWPLIRDLVYEVADNHNFDPAMLAAISYQESHWNPNAVSFSGVRGLMMLTASTAAEVDVVDRTDPRQSLVGGIKYLRNMHNKIPERIQEPDRTLFALAAYNIGYAHVEDARILAQRANKNPDDWIEVEPYLAKLNNPSIAHELRYGNADGKTAVTYVNNIMTYKQLMNWKMNKEIRQTHMPESIL